MSDLHDARAKATAFAARHVAELSKEVNQWQDTGLLEDGLLHELAEIVRPFASVHAMQSAESLVNRAARDLATQAGALHAADVDALAQEIRRVDGANSLGAGALAEALMPFLAATQPNAAPAAEVVARIAELEAQLAPYLEAEAAQERFYARQQRVEKIADMLFPKFDSVAVRSGKKPGPLHWHEKSWWWNGVSVEWASSGGIDDNGGCVELSSYIGGGEVGTTEIDVPKAWLDADEDQWPILVDEYKKKKAQERAVAKAAQEAAEAQRQIEAAKATLRRLNGDAA